MQLHTLQKYDEAIQYHSDAVACMERVRGSECVETLSLLDLLGKTMMTAGKGDKVSLFLCVMPKSRCSAITVPNVVFSFSINVCFSKSKQ
jgi:hypothetical protein